MNTDVWVANSCDVKIQFFNHNSLSGNLVKNDTSEVFRSIHVCLLLVWYLIDHFFTERFGSINPVRLFPLFILK